MRKFSGIVVILQFVCVSNALAQTPIKFRDTTIKGSQTFAFIVGVSNYKYVRPLSYADKDAELFRDFLKSPGGGSVKDDNIYFLTNEKVNNANFWSKGFQWLKAKDLRSGDRLFIYMAGHGDAIDEDQFFFLGYDCNPGGDKNNYLVGGAIQLFNLKKKIAAETTKGVEVFFIMDACRSNELPGGMPGLNFLNTAISEKKAGELIMLATGAGQESLEDASIGNGHGLFTYYLVDGLAGMADSPGTLDHKISFAEIENYVSQKVPDVAQNQFKRKQEPFFCCDENKNAIISNVDTAYLRNWMKRKKGPGNSFRSPIPNKRSFLSADTTMSEIYDLFYKAVRDKKFTGTSSAEYFYGEMNKRSSGSPYTLDARSTLEVEYINDAQNRVNQYLDCGEFTKKQKQENFEAALKLEKAINLVKNDEPEFANSLLGRMFFLKASGDFEKNNLSQAFQYAFASYALDPGAAYINNRLATLHLENNNIDSAVYYARRAMIAAPKWKCSYATLSATYKILGLKDSADKYKRQSQSADPSKPIEPSTKINKRPQFGMGIGGGVGKLNMTLSNWDQGQVNYNDSLRGINVSGKPKFEIGVHGQFDLTNIISLRPTILFSSEKREITYLRRTPTGGEPVETINLQTSTVNVGLPVILRFTQTNVVPYLSAAPVASILVNQGGNADKVPVKSFDMLAEGILGADIHFNKGGLILSPELKFSLGFGNMIKNANNLYTNTISQLKRQGITFTISLRKG